MRLKLNRTLRAALIAAITAVATTLTQAQANQQTSAIFNFGNDDISTHKVGETYDYLWGEAGGIQATITATGVLSNDTYSGTDVSYDTGITGETFGAFTTQNVLDTKGTLVSANKETLTLTLTGLEQGGKYNVALLTGYSPSDSGKWNYLETSNDYVESHFAMGATAEKVAKANPSGYAISSIKADSDGAITITVHANGSHRTTFFGVALDYVPSKTLTWAGTTDNHVWQSTGVWADGGEFSSGDDAIFNSAAQSKDVTINSAVQAGEVVVEGQNYTFTIVTDGSLAAGKFSVSDGSQTVVLDGGSFTPGTIAIAANSALTIDNKNQTAYAVGSATGAGDLILTTGTFTIGDFGSTGKLAVNGATLELGSSRHTIATLEIGDGGVVNATGADNANGCVSGDIDIKAGGTFKVTGHHDAFGWSNSATQNIILTGESGKLATLELNQTSGGSATMKTNIAMHGYSKITSTNNSNGFNTFGGSIVAENTNNTIDKIQLRSDATIEVKASGELSVGNMVTGQDGNHNLTKTGEGTLTFTGTANMNSLTLNGGSVVFNGTSSIANGLTQAEGKSITVGATGSLTLGGTVTFGHQAISVTEGGSIAKGSNLKFNLDGLTASEAGGTYTYTLFSGAAVDLSAMSLSTSDLILEGGTSGKNWVFGTDGTISYTASTEKVWTQEWPGNWNYEEANWNTDQKFEAGDVAVFEGEPMVTVNAEVEAGGIIVRDDTNMWLMAQDNATLSSPIVNVGQNANLASMISIDGVETFSVGTGSSWGISADQQLGTGVNDGAMDISEGCEVTITSLTNNGTVNVQENASLYLGDTTTVDELSRMSNDGTLSVALGSDTTLINMHHTDPDATQLYGTLVVRSGTVDYRSNLDGQTLQLGNGTTLLFGTNGTNGTDTEHTYAGDIKVAEGDTATVRTWGKNTQPYVKISGDVSGRGTLVRYNDGNQNLDFTGTVNLGGYTNSDAQAGSSTDFQGATTLGTLTADAGSTTKFSGSKAELGSVTLNGNAAVEINTAATVSSLLDLSAGGNSSGTVTVKAGKSLSIAQSATYWGAENSSIVVEEDGTLNLAGMQIVGVDGSAVVGTTAANEQYGIGKGSWSIYGADITATKAITVGNELSFSSVNTGEYAVQLTNENNLLAGATVGENGSLSMTGGELLDVIANAGSVTLTSITLSDEIFIEEGGEEGAHFGLDGKATEGANYYLGTTDKYVTVVDGGTSATGSNITWGTTTGLTMTDGKVVTQAGEVAYGTFYVNDDSVNVSAITNTNTTNVEVAGGTLVVDTETALNIVVTNEGTITGDHADATQIGIAQDGWANFTEPVETSGVKFTAAPEEVVLIINNGESTQKYTVEDKNMNVMAQTLEMTKADGDVTVSNAVYVEEIVNEKGHKLTLSNAETLELKSMLIGEDSTVELLYTDQEAQKEGTVTITDTLTAGGGTLLANLTIADADLEDGVNPLLDVNGGGDNALTLGSQFTIAEGTLVTLDDDTIAALEGMQIGQSLDIIRALEETGLTYGEEGQAIYDGMWFGQLFERTDGVLGDYLVYANDTAFGLTKVSKTPEPTTGTLSLLALAALAARRRRK